MLVAENLQMEKIIDQRVNKTTRRKTYFEYLIKWKGHPIEDASWEREEDIQKHGQTVQESWIGAHEFFSQSIMMQEHNKEEDNWICNNAHFEDILNF